MQPDRPTPPRVAPVLTHARSLSSALLPAVALVAVVVLGVLGRFLPVADPAGGEAAWSYSAGPSGGIRSEQGTGPRLLVPVADVLWIGTTEIAARGVVDPGVDLVEAVVLTDRALLGKATLEVDPSGHFDGVVAITPPAARTAARLEVRQPGRAGPPIAEVGFLVEAGSPVLIVGASSLRARVGQTTIVDVLVYESLFAVRAVVTGPGGTLITETTSLASLRDPRNPPGQESPATLMLRVAIPDDVRPSFARLHVVGLDRPGHEVAHVDANLSIAAAR